MPEPMDRLLRKHASREYLWFALILLAMLAGSIIRQAEINDSHAKSTGEVALSGLAFDSTPANGRIAVDAPPC